MDLYALRAWKAEHRRRDKLRANSDPTIRLMYKQAELEYMEEFLSCLLPEYEQYLQEAKGIFIEKPNFARQQKEDKELRMMRVYISWLFNNKSQTEDNRSNDRPWQPWMTPWLMFPNSISFSTKSIEFNEKFSVKSREDELRENEILNELESIQNEGSVEVFTSVKGKRSRTKERKIDMFNEIAAEYKVIINKTMREYGEQYFKGIREDRAALVLWSASLDARYSKFHQYLNILNKSKGQKRVLNAWTRLFLSPSYSVSLDIENKIYEAATILQDEKKEEAAEMKETAKEESKMLKMLEKKLDNRNKEKAKKEKAEKSLLR